MSEYDGDDVAIDLEQGLEQDIAWYNAKFDDSLDDEPNNDVPSDDVGDTTDDDTPAPADDGGDDGQDDKPTPPTKPYTPPPNEAKTEIKRPVLEEFDDYGAYEDAMEEYYIAKAEQRYEAKQAQAQEAERQAVLEREFAKAVDELANDGVDIVALQAQAETLPPLPVSLDNFGLSVKDTLKLAKDLMDDTALYYELAQMNPYQMAMRVGRFLDERAGGQSTPQTPPKPKQSKAPPPIKPVTANSVAVKGPYASSDDDFLKSRGLS